MQIYGMTGEPLGVIGHESESSSQKLPSWKQDFLAKPSASIRKGIAWGYDTAYEDTDTLVLTAPSGNFVDVRFPKIATSPSEAASHQSFWAFSGEAITTFYDAGGRANAVGMPYTAHCKFLHAIDSRGRDIADEGDMFLLGNGDLLEMGKMVNPASGAEELYKEYWRSAGKLLDVDGQDDSNTCIVARTSSTAAVDGVVIRLGGRVQGIMSRRRDDGGQTVEVERWVRGEPSHTKAVEEEVKNIPGGSWSRDIRSSGLLPCSWLCTPGRRKDDDLEYNGILWVITEVLNRPD